MHELSLSSAIVNTVAKHAGGRPVAVVNLRVGKLRQVIPDTLEFYFEFVARDSVCEGARLEQEVIDARLRCRPCAREWAIEIPPSAARRAAAARSRSRPATSSRSSQSRSRRPHASHQGDGRRGGAGRQQHDRDRQPGGLRPPRGHGDQLHERAGGGQDDAARAGRAVGRRACASGCSRATCRERWTPTGSPICTSR